MSEEKGVEVTMASGIASSSKIPALHLLPTRPLLRIAGRFELGIERKKEKAWNAISSNQACLTDKEFVLERIGHVINHALKLRDKVQAGKPLEGDDDAAALGWSAMFLCEATEALASQKSCSACGGTGKSYMGAGIDGAAPCPACKGCGLSRL